MSGGLSKVVLKSPDEIEAEITSTPTVTWDPFTVLPREIYVKIFDKLDDPSDKRNFMNAHAKFYALFKSERTRFLFQDVFKEMSKDVGESYRGRTELWNFRLVCQDWNKTVQNYLQLHESNFKFYTNERREFWPRMPQFFWRNGEVLENDMGRFSVTHPASRNPFVTRKISLESFLRNNNRAFDAEATQRYLAAVDDLLEKYGRHIWHCTMSVVRTPQTLRQVAKWLSLMPDLKTLDLRNSTCRGLNEGEIRDMELVQPELEKLVVLKLEGLPSEVCNKLFGNMKELEKILIRLPMRNSLLRNYDVPTRRETLKEAFFILEDINDFFGYVYKGKSFPNLKALAIEKVENYGCEEAMKELPEWRMIFICLEVMFPALEDFSLKLPEAERHMDQLSEEIYSREFADLRLNLPNLKKLWISLPQFSSIDFLLPCKALEELKVSLRPRKTNVSTMFYSYSPRNCGLRYAHCLVKVGVETTKEFIRARRKEKIKFNVDSNSNFRWTTLWESNAWDEFPKLRVLEVEVFNSGGRKDQHRYEKTGENRTYGRTYGYY